ncbi:hypothetical protein OG401_39350 [Kitasatospora purpeofusca]|nr:hypothetical protein [Kitasatospora purpeofusca]
MTAVLNQWSERPGLGVGEHARGQGADISRLAGVGVDVVEPGLGVDQVQRQAVAVGLVGRPAGGGDALRRAVDRGEQVVGHG